MYSVQDEMDNEKRKKREEKKKKKNRNVLKQTGVQVRVVQAEREKKMRTRCMEDAQREKKTHAQTQGQTVAQFQDFLCFVFCVSACGLRTLENSFYMCLITYNA